MLQIVDAVVKDESDTTEVRSSLSELSFFHPPEF